MQGWMYGRQRQCSAFTLRCNDSPVLTPYLFLDNDDDDDNDYDDAEKEGNGPCKKWDLAATLWPGLLQHKQWSWSRSRIKNYQRRRQRQNVVGSKIQDII